MANSLAMLANMGSKERIGFYGLVAAGVLGLGYIGATSMEQPAPMTLEVAPGTTTAAAPTPAAAVPTEVVVHVAGAVRSPAVVRLSPGSRVAEAIAKAGGATQNADLESLNLAAKLEDGTQLYVPRRGTAAEPQKVASAYQGGKTAPARYAGATAKAQTRSETPGKPGGRMVNLNTANQAQLESLPGVGPATAKKILAYRRERGGFTSVDEMLAVKGIGPKKLADMRPYLRL